jgi:carbamoyl-phosphate synthase large subunit
VIVQLGGQTPLKLARGLDRGGRPDLGDAGGAIHEAEDRDAFHALCTASASRSPPGGVAADPDEAPAPGARDRLPRDGASLLRARRPRHAGRPLDAELDAYLDEVYAELPDTPQRARRRLRRRAVGGRRRRRLRRRRTVVAGIMEHVEAAGIHSGDSACIVPPVSLADEVQAASSPTRPPGRGHRRARA